MKNKDENSCAWQAYNTQGRDTPGNESSNYTGHDSFQNGVIEPKNNNTIYVAEFNPGNKSNSSGYFTDQSTVDSCIHNGKLDANELGSKCQTMPSNMHCDEKGHFVENANGAYKQRPYVNAYDIDFNKLEQLGKSNNAEDRQLYEKLTNPDGRGNDSGGIKCAYGQVEANSQFGLKDYRNGGGNQYYIDRDTFNQAKEKGVFVYNEDKSFSESKDNLNRQDISRTIGDDMKKDAENNPAITKTPQQVNSEQVKSQQPGGFICQPDSAYNYNQTENTAKANTSAKTNGISSESVAATTGGGSQAPPKHNNNPDLSDSNNTNKTAKTEQNPEQSTTQKQGVSNNQAENGEKSIEQAKRNQNGQNGGSEPTNTNNSAFPEVKKENLDPKPEQTGKGFESVSKENLDSIDKINAQRKEVEARATGNEKGMNPVSKDGINM